MSANAVGERWDRDGPEPGHRGDAVEVLEHRQLGVDEPLESVVERALTDPVEGPERQTSLHFAIDRGDHQVAEVVEVPEDGTMRDAGALGDLGAAGIACFPRGRA